MLNLPQKLALWIGIGVGLAMLIFPPFDVSGGTVYAPYLSPPPIYSPDSGVRADFAPPASVSERLLQIQLGVAGMITVAAIFTLAGRKEDR